MVQESFGNQLFDRIQSAKNDLFIEGEMAELTFQSFLKFEESIETIEDENISFSIPVGYRADKTAIESTKTYTIEDLKKRTDYLKLTKLPLNGIYQLVTTMETLLNDIVRNVLAKYPEKINNEKKIKYEVVLQANSLEEIKYDLINSIINEFSYKTPSEFGKIFTNLVGVNLLEEPAFHKYLELKATRDIHIHNHGFANEIYIKKSQNLSRVKPGEFLPVTVQYFLESFENCLQLTEFLEENLHKIWPSSKYEESKNQNSKGYQQEEAVEQIIEKGKNQNEAND